MHDIKIVIECSVISTHDAWWKHFSFIYRSYIQYDQSKVVVLLLLRYLHHHQPFCFGVRSLVHHVIDEAHCR